MTLELTSRRFEDLRLSEAGFRNPRLTSGLATDCILELAMSIARTGLQHPLIIRSNGLVLAGQRRYLAIEMFINSSWRSDSSRLNGRAHELALAVPVFINDFDDPKAVALADNLHREDLSDYEISAAVHEMSADDGSTVSSIASVIGKSKTWVSRHLLAWRALVPPAHDLWREGKLTFDRVLFLASLPPEEQVIELAGGRVRTGRGPANRPGIKDVKRALEVCGSDHSTPYAVGVRDALRWVTGGELAAEMSPIIADKDP